MTLTPQWLDELRSRVTLSTLIGRTVKVTRAGRDNRIHVIGIREYAFF